MDAEVFTFVTWVYVIALAAYLVIDRIHTNTIEFQHRMIIKQSKALDDQHQTIMRMQAELTALETELRLATKKGERNA